MNKPIRVSKTSFAAALCCCLFAVLSYASYGQNKSQGRHLGQTPAALQVLSVDLTGGGILCKGSCLTLTATVTDATGPVTFSWSPNTNTTDSTLQVCGDTTTLYTVTVTDSTGATATDTATVFLVDLPTISAGNDTAICAGASLTLNVTGGVSFSWSPTTGLSDSTIGNPDFIGDTTTTFIVTGTDTLGCSNTDTLTVTVNALPVINAGNDTTICEGSSVQLNVTGATTYVYSPTTGLSDSTIANPLATPTVTTSYIITGTDLSGCSSTDTLTITVNAAPVVDAGNDTIICAGDTVMLMATGGVTYSWSPSTGLDSTNIATPTAIPTVTTTYFVTATDSLGCSATDSITVLVIDTGTVVFPAFTSNVCVTDSAFVLNTATPAGGVYSGTGVTNGIFDPSVAGAGTFTITYTITSGSGACMDSASQTITVDSAQGVVSIDSVGTICLNGGTITLTANPSGGTFTGTGVTGNTFDPTVSGAGSFTVTYTVTGVPCLVSSVDSIVITVSAGPTLDAGADTTICLGDSVMLMATGGVTYTWSPVTGLDSINIATPTANPTTTTMYFVTATDSAGCIATDSVLVTVVAPGSVTFPPFTSSVCVTDAPFALTTGTPAGGVYSGTGVTGGNTFDPSLAGVGTFTLTYTVTSGNCTDSASTTITVDTVSGVVTLDTVGTVCIAGGTIALNGTPTGGTFSGTGVSGNTFDPAVAGLGTHTVYYTVTGGCLANNTDSIVITVVSGGGGLTVAIVAAPLNPSCFGDSIIFLGYGPQSVLLTANVTGGTATGYQWFLNNAPIPGATNSTFDATVSGTYTVTATGGGSCASGTSAPLTLNITVVDVRCGSNMDKVAVCHKAGGSGKTKTLCIGVDGVADHLAHGDCIGACGLTPRLAEDEIASAYELTAFPNPFAGQTTIDFAIESDAHVTLQIFDTKGTLVSTPFDRDATSDHYSIIVDASDLAEGIYVAKLTVGNDVEHHRLMLTK